MTTTEVEWDDETRSKAMALEFYRASLCPNCGLPADVCQAGANEFAFEADGPYRCHARTAVSEARARVGEDVKAPEALMFKPRLKDGGAS